MLMQYSSCFSFPIPQLLWRQMITSVEAFFFLYSCAWFYPLTPFQSSWPSLLPSNIITLFDSRFVSLSQDPFCDRLNSLRAIERSLSAWDVFRSCFLPLLWRATILKVMLHLFVYLPFSSLSLSPSFSSYTFIEGDECKAVCHANRMQTSSSKQAVSFSYGCRCSWSSRTQRNCDVLSRIFFSFHVWIPSSINSRFWFFFSVALIIEEVLTSHGSSACVTVFIHFGHLFSWYDIW